MERDSRPKKDDRIVRRPRGYSYRPAHRRNRSQQQQNVTPTPHSSPSITGRHASYSSPGGSGVSAPNTNTPRHKSIFSVARFAKRFRKAALSNQRKSRSLPTALKLNRRFEPEFQEPPPLLNDDEDEEDITLFENPSPPIQPVIDPEREAAAYAEAEEEKRSNDEIENAKWRELNRLLQAMKMEDDWANSSTASMGAIEQKRKRHYRDERSSGEDKREKVLQGKKKKKKSFDIREQPSEEEEQEVSADGSEEENEELASFLTSGDDDFGEFVESSDAVFHSPLRCPAPDPIEMLQGGLLVRASPRTLTPTPAPATITAIPSFHTSSPSGSSILLTPLASPSRSLKLINQSSSSTSTSSSSVHSTSSSSSSSSSRLASRSGSMYTSTSSSEEESSSSCASSPVQSSNESDPHPPPRRRRRHHTHTSARHSTASRAEQFRPTMPPLDFSLLKPLMGPATIAAGNSSSGRESGVSSGSGRRTLSARLQTPRATKATPRDCPTPNTPPDTPPPDPTKRVNLGDSRDCSAFTKCVLRSTLSSQSV